MLRTVEAEEDVIAIIDRVATIEEDRELLARYRDMACSELIEHLRNFVTKADFSGETLEMTLEVSGSYDDSFTSSLLTDIFSFIVASIAGRWFRITWKERAGEYEQEAERLVSEAIRKLYHRKRPRRELKNQE